MRLSYNEKANILKYFPHLELSYEKRLHKKVQADIYLTIPKGKKFFAWFKNYKNKNMCFLLEIDKKRNSILNINVNTCSFDSILCSGKGTIFYGTIFYVNKKKLFNIENIFYSKGHSLKYLNQHQKFNEINNIMKNNIKQVFCTKNSIVFGTPIIDTNCHNLKLKIKKLPYSIYCIQYRLLYKNKPFINEIVKIQKDIQKIFLVKPTIIDDIYNLYFKNDDKLEKYDIACIPDYKTSVMMNSLFRNIKENRNLDLLEESDDEEEFENINIDKYVYLDKTFKMKCVYIEQHNSWKPVEISNQEVSPKREIIYYKKNNR